MYLEKKIFIIVYICSISLIISGCSTKTVVASKDSIVHTPPPTPWEKIGSAIMATGIGAGIVLSALNGNAK